MVAPFVGVDGVGGNLTVDGFTSHEYTMLRVGEHWTDHDWLRFLVTRPKGALYVSYFFDYDVSMMLRDLPEAALAVLVDTGAVQVGPYRLAYRPRKEFSVRVEKKVTTVSDVGTFFQCRFVTALERWDIGTPERRALIAAEKDNRSQFGALTPEVIAYNGMECEDLAALMEKFRRTCTAIGYLPRQWQGPGQLAKAMFRAQGIPLTKDLPVPPPGVWEMAQAAYYGGRFECSSIGPVMGPIEAWDINSAYPFACLALPCLSHGRWSPSRDIHPDGVYRVRFTHPAGRLWYTLPIRTRHGNIRFPREGEGWYWGVELLAAQAMGARLSVAHGWQISRPCDCRPFDFMHRLYALRKAVGKSEAGIALKLAMNSAYGITAQSIGNPPYANPVWAGLITAITRARLLEALAVDPYKVHMLATDGLFASPGLNLPTGDNLGDWELTTYPDGMHIVQPGVYFTGHKSTCDRVECKCAPKTRGVPLSAVQRHEAALKLAWNGNDTDGYEIPLRQFIGLRLGVAQGNYHKIGTWIDDVPRKVGYDWQTKRRPGVLRGGPYGYRTVPYEGSPSECTIPYAEAIGNLAKDRERLEWADMPDWAETLTVLE